MVGDGRQLSLGQELRESHGKGHLHRNGEGVFDDHYLNVELFDKIVEGTFQVDCHIADAIADLTTTPCSPPNALVDPQVFGMAEICFRYAVGDFWLPIAPTAIPVTDVLILPQHMSPLCALQGDAVGSSETGGYKPDVYRHDLGLELITSKRMTC